MNKKPVIQIRIPDNLKREKWILKEIFLRIGYPFAFVVDWDNFAIKIAYGLYDQQSDLILIEGNPDWQNILIPDVAKVEGYLIAYLPGKRPTRLFSDKYFNVDIVGMGLYFLSGRAMNIEREEHGLLNHELNNIFKYPLFDIACIGLKRAIISVSNSRKYISLSSLNWPNGSRVAAVITHDIDHLKLGGIPKILNILTHSNDKNPFCKLSQKITRVTGELYNYGISGSYSRIYKCIEIEKEAGIKSTFFVYAGKPDFPINPSYSLDDVIQWEDKPVALAEVLTKIAKDGWEIGMHGSVQASEDKDYLEEELRRITNITPGLNVVSIRHHRLAFDQTKTWKMHKETGFLIDSTIGFNCIYGFASGTAFPFTVLDSNECGTRLLEIPVVVQDIEISKQTRKSSNTTPSFIDDYYKIIYDSAGGTLTQIWHPEHFNGRDGDKVISCFKRAISYLSNSGVWFATLSQLRQAWLDREKILMVTSGEML